MNGSCTCEQDLQLASASPHVNGTIAQGNAIQHENISTYHAIPRQALSYTIYTRHAIQCTMPYHTMPATRYHIPCQIWLGNTICHVKPGRQYPISCQTSPGHTIYNTMPTRPYHIPCHTPPGHTIYCVMPDRPYHTIPQQTITYTIPYLTRPVHIPCDAHQAIPFTMPCPQDHTIYHAMSARPHHKPCQTMPGHTLYHPIPRQAIPYTMPCPPGHTIYHARPVKQYHISCHVHQAVAYNMPCPQDGGQDVLNQ